jgi:hypothetical protein
MSFYHFYEEEFWVIEPLEINRFRNVRKPLIIGYELKFIGIRPSEITPGAPYIPQFYSVFEPPVDKFLIDLQRQLILTLSLLAQIHLIMGIFADAAALRVIGDVELGIDVVLSAIDELQYNGGTMDISMDTLISLGQSILSLSLVLTNIPEASKTATLIQLISTLNAVAVSLFELLSFPTLFSGSFANSINIPTTLSTNTLFQPSSL